jgi:dUTP pyrophosphatase
MIIDLVRVDESLPLPERATVGASGYDLRASIKNREGVGSVSAINAEVGYIEIYPGQVKIIPVGIKVQFDLGHEIQIRARSGLALKKGVTVINGIGTIDADYRGEIMAGLVNHSAVVVKIRHGDRISQMVACPIIPVWIRETNELCKTERGCGGLGHTGDN